MRERERAATATDETHADAAAAEFIERMGVVAQGDGLPRIAGRLIGFFVIHGGPVSFGELSERMQVSRASVSNNTRLLERLGVIERISRAGDRQDYFRLADGPYRRLLEGVVERMARAHSVVEKAERDLPPDWEGAHHRLQELGQFYASAEENTRGLLRTLSGQNR